MYSVGVTITEIRLNSIKSSNFLININREHQTVFIMNFILQDIADLFGADLPVDGGKGGQFSWRDGLFLQALKSGHWIVLDEVSLNYLQPNFPVALATISNIFLSSPTV